MIRGSMLMDTRHTTHVIHRIHVRMKRVVVNGRGEGIVGRKRTVRRTV